MLLFLLQFLLWICATCEPVGNCDAMREVPLGKDTLRVYCVFVGCRGDWPYQRAKVKNVPSVVQNVLCLHAFSSCSN